MNYESFLERCQELPETQRKWTVSFCKRIDEVFGDEDPDFGNIDSICQLFGGFLGVSKSQFYRRRVFVILFYDWLRDQNMVNEEVVEYVRSLKLRDVVTEYELSRYYFGSLDEVLDFVKLVAGTKSLDGDDDLLSLKSLIVMTWYGLETDEIINVRKVDLNRSNNNLSILADGRSVQMEGRHFDILQRFADIDLHRGYDLKVREYVSSPYLMRSSRSQQTTENGIAPQFVRFNELSIRFGKKLIREHLRRNGVFYKTLKSGVNERRVAMKIAELAQCDRHVAFGYKEMYERWKNWYKEV